MKKYWFKAVEQLKVLRQVHSAADAFLFLRIFAFALIVPLLLHVKPNRLEAVLAAKRTGTRPNPVTTQKITSYVDGALRLGHPLLRRGCLTRTLTLYYFLIRSGLDLQVSFGMGKIQGAFLGHCWLEQDGEPFLEKQDPRPLFQPVYRFPRAVTLFGDVSQPLNPFRQTYE